jgi:FtsZ-interacting cell division protein ZipA
MENIRWMLLLAGIVIVLGIYIVARLKTMQFRLPRRRKAARPGGRDRKTPPSVDGISHDALDTELDDFDELFVDKSTPDVEENIIAAPAREKAPAVSPDHVFSLFVLAPHGVPFRGQLLLGALATAGMKYGDMQIFHRVEEIDGHEKVLFSAANIREPGIFDLSAMESFTTEGIAFFMQVHGGVDAVSAFESMVESARILADSLNGTICDATHSVLTRQTISHMRDEVISCQLQQRVAKTAS